MSDYSIMIVGGAWNRDDLIEGLPFQGTAGKLLTAQLARAGIVRDECYLTNVFNFQPRPTNAIENLCGDKATGMSDLPPVAPSKYLLPQYYGEVKRLYREIETVKPNVIIALGPVACWALLGSNQINKIRGTTTQGHKDFKVLPTHHPSAVLRDPKLSPVFAQDLLKAKRESRFAEVRRPARSIHIAETVEDITDFEKTYMSEPGMLSMDIETVANQITRIGFAPSTKDCLVIPIHKASSATNTWWVKKSEERFVWDWIARILNDPKYSLVGQNFIYDMTFLWRQYGITCSSAAEDTMLAHHALQIEMQKGLGFLASVYTNEASWKFMRKSATIKKED